VRPMFVEFPRETALANVHHQFMFGENILVVPKLERFSDGECRKNECPFDPRNLTGFGLRNYDLRYDNVEVFLP